MSTVLKLLLVAILVCPMTACTPNKSGARYELPPKAQGKEGDMTAKVKLDTQSLLQTKSRYDVAVTIDRLEQAASAKGLKIFARIDHHKNAKAAGLDLRPTQVLIFGAPKIGTPLMQDAPTIAIDLPVKALAYEDAQGQVWLVFNTPDYLARRHGIKDTAPLQKMAGALAALGEAATK